MNGMMHHELYQSICSKEKTSAAIQIAGQVAPPSYELSLIDQSVWCSLAGALKTKKSGFFFGPKYPENKEKFILTAEISKINFQIILKIRFDFFNLFNPKRSTCYGEASTTNLPRGPTLCGIGSKIYKKKIIIDNKENIERLASRPN